MWGRQVPPRANCPSSPTKLRARSAPVSLTKQEAADIFAHALRHRSRAILIKGFISYAHDDYGAFEKLRIHIKGIEQSLSGKIDFWADRRIQAGDYCTERIHDAIATSQVHLLLISAEFLASSYIDQYELPAINDKYAAGDLVVPIILKSCMWEPFVGPLQAVPTHKGRVVPICDWSPQNNGFYMATRQIADAIEAHFSVALEAARAWRRR